MNTKSESPVKQDKSDRNPPEKKILGHVPLPDMQREFGGRKGPEATRFGDWELNGKCVDF